MGYGRPALYVKHFHSGVGNGFPEDKFGVGLYGGLDFGVGGIGPEETDLYAKLCEGYAKEVEGAAVDIVGRDYVVSGACNVEDGKEVCGLAGGGEDGPYTAFKGVYLGRNCIHGGILKAGIEVTAVFEVKEAAHLVRSLIFEGSALDNWNLAGGSLSGIIAGVYAKCIYFCHFVVFFLMAKVLCLEKVYKLYVKFGKYY